MNTQEILAKQAERNAKKGPKPQIADYVGNFLKKHGDRVEVKDFNAVIAKLTEQRDTNAKFEAEVAQAQANVAAQKAAELAAAAAATTAPATVPATATV